MTTTQEDFLRFNVLVDAYADAAMQYAELGASSMDEMPGMTRAQFRALQSERQAILNDARRALTDHVNTLIVNAQGGKYVNTEKKLQLADDGSTAVDLSVAPVRDVTKPGMPRDALSLDDLVRDYPPTEEG